MNIQELEKRTGITKQNIRFYERKGLLCPKRNTANNYREYTEEDERTLKTIRLLRKLDVSIEEIREMLEGRLGLEKLMQGHLAELQDRQKELNAGISICKKLTHTDLSALDTEAVLEEMEKLEAQGERFMTILDDYKIFAEAERKRTFSFVPDNMALTPAEFSEALFQYAKENGLSLVITKESMYPVFEIDGVEYTAVRRFGRFGAMIRCTMTHPEELEDELKDIPGRRRKWFRAVSTCLIPAGLFLYFIAVSGDVILGLLMGVCIIPLLAWNFLR